MTKPKTKPKTKTKPAGNHRAIPFNVKQIVQQGITITPEQMEAGGYYGWCILVVDRGFVWIGDTVRVGDSIYCVGAQNIRAWGVKKGLGQLATTGPTNDTQMDPCPCVIVPMRAIIAIIPAKLAPWAKWRKSQ